MREYQKVAALKMGELWAIPTMLRLGLVENIRRMTLRVAARLDEVELADAWAARLMSANEKSPEALTAELKTFHRRSSAVHADFRHPFPSPDTRLSGELHSADLAGAVDSRRRPDSRRSSNAVEPEDRCRPR